MRAAVSKASGPLPKHSGLPKGTKNMSEQKTSFMALLDQWLQSVVIDPLIEDAMQTAMATDRSAQQEWQQHLTQTTSGVKKAIRQKVLESYHNGQAAGPRRPLPPR